MSGWQTTTEFVLKSADSAIQLVDSSTDSNAETPKIGVWSRALVNYDSSL